MADAILTSTTTRAAAQGARHTALASRAYDALRAAGAPIPAEQLTRDVFGLVTAGPAGRWASLLDTVLADDARFARTPDGWTLGRERPSGGGEAVVAVAIATTGADPRRHRIVRLAAARHAAGGVVARLDTPLNPRRRLAGYLQSAARLSQDDAEVAPSFGEVVEQLRELLGGEPIHSYGAGWVRAFLEAELARIEAPGLANPYVELADAAPLRVARGKPTLATLADALGISHPRPGYPPADADVAARVALALRAADATVADAGAQPPPCSTEEPGAPALLDRRWLADVPSRPGVYVIEDAAGAVLYVGKAVDLRRRLTAYVGRAFGLHRRLDGLAVRAARVRTKPTATDVEARLLEAHLVRRHRPPFNVQRRVRRSATILRVAPRDPGPCFRAVRDVAPDGATYFGPYRSARVARAHLELVRAIYPAAVARGTPSREGRRRTAALTDSERQAAALVDEERRTAALACIRVLSGQKDAALGLLRARMRREGLAGDAPAVEQTRRLIRATLDLEPCPSPLLGIAPTEPLLVIERLAEGGYRAHLVRDGYLAASTTTWAVHDPTSLRALADHLGSVAVLPDDPEDAHIALRWLMEPAAGRTIVPLRRLAT